MKTELPTKPGPYYWLESDVYEWEHIFVMDPGNGHLYGHDGVVATSLHDWEQDYGAVGQWLPIPTAEELVELQACKFELQNIVKANAKEWGMPNDEFMYEFHAWAVNRAKNVLGIYRGEHGTIIRKAKR